jgi:hypothetical protein
VVRAERDERKKRQEQSVLRFLVEECDEGDDLGVRGTTISSAYFRHFPCNDRELMSAARMYDILENVFEFKRESRQVLGSLGKPRQAVFFRGVNLKPWSLAMQPTLPAEVAALAVGPQLENIAASHVLIKDTLYARSLIAVVRPIKPFKKFDGGTATHIVTFNNPQVRQQYLERTEAAKVLAQFGQEVGGGG